MPRPDPPESVDLVANIHEQSFGTYGTRRLTAQLRLGLGREVNHKRVERLKPDVRPRSAATRDEASLRSKQRDR
jgi:putative transposase